MKAIIIGCGKLGSGLALQLVQRGHKVTIIDMVPEAFRLLGSNFGGETMAGIGFDREVLEKAQIKTADAVIACSKSDQVNALIGRIARNIYRVPHVISRLYDPRQAEIYRTLGIQTISTTTWGVQRALAMLSYSQFDSMMTIGNNNVEVVRIEVPALLVGRTVNEVTAIGEIQVISITRGNNAFLPTLGTILQAHDVIYLAVMPTSVNRLKAMLGLD